MLCAFGSVEAAAATVSGIIAAGILPAALEMMDAHITRAVEDFVGAGYPRDAEAVLLVELDGLGAGVAEQVEAVRAIAQQHDAVSTRVAADEHERALLWKGRKSAFGAIARDRTRLLPARRGRAADAASSRCCGASTRSRTITG